MYKKSTIDPILVSIIERRMDAITKEMGVTLLRTTRSPVFHEARDFVTGLYNKDGGMLAQTEYIPILAFAISPSLNKLIEFFGDEIYPGDVFIQNDVYYGGNQSQDIAIFKPIFYEGELLFWAATKGHHIDVGGSSLGGYNPLAKDVWQETFRLTPLKFYEKGELRKDVWNLILENNRLPDTVGGDLIAQAGGCTVGERGMLGLVEKYGLERLRDHQAFLVDATEKQMRSEISKIPDGVYEGEATNDGDGITKGKIYKVKITLTVKGDEITFDYTGTDPQAPNYINARYTTTVCMSILILLMNINPEIAHNEGMLKPIHFVIPEGTLLNARFPAPTAAGNFTCSDLIADAFFKAFASAIPERITAGWQRCCTGPMGGLDPRSGKMYADTAFLSAKGGGGATYGMDGWNHIGLIACAGGLRAPDYEMHEIANPHFLVKHEYWQDSAGAGKWRGGLGVHNIIKSYAINPIMNMHGDGTKKQNAPFGIFGGMNGKVNENYYFDQNGNRVTMNPNRNYSYTHETVFEFFAGGGGGFGPPLLRDVNLVREDALNEVVSIESAKKDYGVVIDPKTFEVMESETESLRKRKLKKLDKDVYPF